MIMSLFLIAFIIKVAANKHWRDPGVLLLIGVQPFSPFTVWLYTLKRWFG